MSEIRENIDSREGFPYQLDSPSGWERIEADEPTQDELDAAEVPTNEDYAEMDAMFEAMDRQDALDDDEYDYYDDYAWMDSDNEY